MTGFIALGLGATIVSFIFLMGWVWSLRINNFSLVDAVWAFSIGLISCFWLWTYGVGSLKHWTAGLLIALWSVRLGSHLQRRIRKIYPEEDARYGKLREVWEGHVKSAFFWFFQAQALSVILLALPFLLIALDKRNSWCLWETTGLMVVMFGILGEGWADFQMSQFKRKNPDAGAVCQTGWWKYSRHPNYFFEAMIWFGFYLYACGSSWGWTMIHAPVAITYLLLKVTGIPPTEAASLIKKGDAYRDYQKTTNAFFPWFPRQIN